MRCVSVLLFALLFANSFFEYGYDVRERWMAQVRGKDAVGAKMNSTELERERGIAFQSAARVLQLGQAPTRRRDTSSTSSTPPGMSTLRTRSSGR